MKKHRHAAIASVVLLLFAVAAGAVERKPSLLDERDPGPAMGGRIDGAVQDTVKPAYRFLEGITDGAYGFVRSRLIRRVLPGI
jgi:hypothetical protein